MNTQKLRFDNSELGDNSLADGTVYRDIDGNITKLVYAIDERISDDCGAELFVHEFNEVAILEALIKVERNEPNHINGKTDLAHNLNAESDGEYVEERNLLHGYISSDRLPAIDHVFTPEETDAIRLKAKGKIVHRGR